MRRLAAAAIVAVLVSSAGRVGAEAPAIDSGAQAYRALAAGLDGEQRQRFLAGRDLFDTRWVIFWFEHGEWGAGPTFNAKGCGECHAGNGRGAAVPSGDGVHQMIVRLSLPGANAIGGPVPDPIYGDQLQTRGVQGVVSEEGGVALSWIESALSMADGEVIALRRPGIALRDLRFGPIGASVLTSARAAPALVGMGLLDAVPDGAIVALAAREPVDGIRGRPNVVWDYATRRSAIGRFGHKATHPTLRQQIAAAFSADIGVSSDYFPDQNCPGPQSDCRDLMPAGKPELGQVRWAALEIFLRASDVPPRRDVDDPAVRRGERLFAGARCSVCHRTELKIGAVPGVALHGSVAARPGRGSRGRASRFSGERARMAHRAAVGDRPHAGSQRRGHLSPRRKGTQPHRSDSVARRRSPRLA
ncbi:MAG: di-heme oxidoredictase family protein [Betaproteobacteria bacterium]